MSAEAKSRRWLQFSMRTLFVVVTLFAFWLEWQLHIVGERRTMLAVVQAHGGFFTPHKPDQSIGVILWMRTRCLNDVDVSRLFLPRDDFTENDEADAKALFPEATIFRSHGHWVP